MYIVTHIPANKDNTPWQVLKRHLNEDISMMQAWREYLQLTQATLAQRLGISQAAYAQYEKLTRQRLSTLEKVAKALGISVTQLR